MPRSRLCGHPIWLLVCLVFAFGASAGEDEAIAVSVSQSHHMSVPVKVNGQETLSVIDTAATIALIDVDLLPDIEVSTLEAEIVVQGLSDTTTYAATDIDVVEVGTETLRAMPAGIITDRGFPSHTTIIPANAFTQRVIDFDFKQGVIAVYDRRPALPKQQAVSRLRYDTIGGLIFIPIKINGKRGRALIDTGANSSFINGAFADLANVRERPELSQYLVGVDLEETPVRIVRLRRLMLGEYRLKNFDLLASDPEMFTALGLEDEPVMLLGLNVLRHFRLQIDREKREVWLSRKN
ncbi:MAG: hypothetical protein Hens3KO_19110 [Henriciella sp.]